MSLATCRLRTLGFRGVALVVARPPSASRALASARPALQDRSHFPNLPRLREPGLLFPRRLHQPRHQSCSRSGVA
eukprot:15434054-Alexandrium_andersonii.AAC.1